MTPLDEGRAAVRNRSARTGFLLTWLVVAAASVTGCADLRSLAAPPGARPGVDVPSHSAVGSSMRLGTPELAPGGQGGYTFLRSRADGSPVAFDPCRPVHVVVRPDQEPAGGRKLLLAALTEVSAATGLQFLDDGTTDEAPGSDREPYQPERYGDRWAPVLITWSTTAESPDLAGGVLGRAGPYAFGSDEDHLRFVTGSAVFNGPALDTQLRQGEDDKAKAVLLHELGHLVGLGHVADPYQVMFDTNAYPLPSYRAGDLRGLETLGLGRCFEDY